MKQGGASPNGYGLASVVLVLVLLVVIVLAVVVVVVFVVLLAAIDVGIVLVVVFVVLVVAIVFCGVSMPWPILPAEAGNTRGAGVQQPDHSITRGAGYHILGSKKRSTHALNTARFK